MKEADLPKLGNMLTLPAGCKFEAKKLDKNLTIIPANDLAHSVLDNFRDTYEGCGFDNACRYTP